MDPIYSEPKLIKQIAKGGEGTVYLARWNNQDIVVKIPHDPNSSSVSKELQVFKNIDHPNLLSLIGEIHQKRWLLFPYMEKGALSKILFGNPPLSWPYRLELSSDVTKALTYLHDKKILHCDLKAENILVDQYGRAKIADFGTAQFKGNFSYPWGGSPAYWAPELIPWVQKLPKNELTDSFPEAFKMNIQGEFPPFTVDTDTYALGTLFWEIAEQYSASCQIKFISRKFRLDEIPSTYAQWIQECRSPDPQARPSLKSLSKTLSDPKTREEFLEMVGRHLTATQIVFENQFPSTVVTSFKNLSLFPFSDIQANNQFQESLEKLIKTFEKTSEEWELLAERLLKNPTYFSQMTFEQQRLLQQLVLSYGQQNFGTEKWNAFEDYILAEGKWNQEMSDQWHLGLAEIRIYTHSNLIESLPHLHSSPSSERLSYAQSTFTLSWLWDTLKETLKTSAHCRFYDVSSHYLLLLKETQEAFSQSEDPFIKKSLPLLIKESCNNVDPLIDRLYKRFNAIAKESEPTLKKSLLEWHETCFELKQWKWVEKLHREVLIPLMTPFLREGQQIDVKAFTEAVSVHVMPYLSLYAAHPPLQPLVKATQEWVIKMALEKGSKARLFDSFAFEKEIKPSISISEKITTSWIQSIWNTSKEQTETVVESLQSALNPLLPFLGEAPSLWTLVGFSSHPLELLLLIDQEEARSNPYWERLINLLDTLTHILDPLGKWEGKEYLWQGNHLKKQNKQLLRGENPLLIQTPSNLSQWVVRNHLRNEKNDDYQHTLYIAGHQGLLPDYQETLKKDLNKNKTIKIEEVIQHQKGPFPKGLQTGLNFEIICQTKDCSQNGKKQYQALGLGNHNIALKKRTACCSVCKKPPMQEGALSCLLLWDCHYNIQIITETEKFAKEGSVKQRQDLLYVPLGGIIYQAMQITLNKL